MLLRATCCRERCTCINAVYSPRCERSGHSSSLFPASSVCLGNKEPPLSINRTSNTKVTACRHQYQQKYLKNKNNPCGSRKQPKGKTHAEKMQYCSFHNTPPIPPHAYAWTHTDTHSHAWTHTHSHTHMHIYTHTHTEIEVRTSVRAHTQTDRHRHARTHPHTRTHRRAQRETQTE